MILSERGANVSDERQTPDELRKAREAMRGERGDRTVQDTEAMRRAMIHYKRIVDDALGSSRLAPETRSGEMAS
jgi:hypothetical protein